MTKREITEIVGLIAYKPGWSVSIDRDYDDDRSLGRLYVQLAVSALAEASRDPTDRTRFRCVPWKSGKRYLSPHMCRQEIVGVVFGLIQDAEMHEVREWFRYRGAAIYNAHLDPDVLVEVARKASSFCVREDAMAMSEPPGCPLA